MSTCALHLLAVRWSCAGMSLRRCLRQISRMLAGYIAGSRSGGCFAWGTASNFQLGERPMSGLGGGQGGKKPYRVTELPSDVSAVATSNMHTVVACSSGSVWASGLGVGGRLGLGCNTSQPLFRRVPALLKVRVAALAVRALAHVAHARACVASFGRLPALAGAALCAVR